VYKPSEEIKKRSAWPILPEFYKNSGLYETIPGKRPYGNESGWSLLVYFIFKAALYYLKLYFRFIEEISINSGRLCLF
jgi:hypothetical protein